MSRKLRVGKTAGFCNLLLAFIFLWMDFELHASSLLDVYYLLRLPGDYSVSPISGPRTYRNPQQEFLNRREEVEKLVSDNERILLAALGVDRVEDITADRLRDFLEPNSDPKTEEEKAAHELRVKNAQELRERLKLSTHPCDEPVKTAQGILRGMTPVFSAGDAHIGLKVAPGGKSLDPATVESVKKSLDANDDPEFSNPVTWQRFGKLLVDSNDPSSASFKRQLDQIARLAGSAEAGDPHYIFGGDAFNAPQLKMLIDTFGAEHGAKLQKALFGYFLGELKRSFAPSADKKMIDLKNVYFIPGNHDIPRAVTKSRNLADMYPKENIQAFTKMLNDLGAKLGFGPNLAEAHAFNEARVITVADEQLRTMKIYAAHYPLSRGPIADLTSATQDPGGWARNRPEGELPIVGGTSRETPAMILSFDKHYPTKILTLGESGQVLRFYAMPTVGSRAKNDADPNSFIMFGLRGNHNGTTSVYDVQINTHTNDDRILVTSRISYMPTFAGAPLPIVQKYAKIYGLTKADVKKHVPVDEGYGPRYFYADDEPLWRGDVW